MAEPQVVEAFAGELARALAAADVVLDPERLEEQAARVARIVVDWRRPAKPEPLFPYLAVALYAGALRATGWNDADGLCWCLQSQEETGEPHRSACARARLLLGQVDGVRRELHEPIDRELPPSIA